jgi:hypothetical protein
MRSISSLLSRNSRKTMTEAANDKCYSSTATAHKKGQISSLEFFQRILHHFGPAATRVHHPEDDSPPKVPDFMIFNGLFGHVASSIKLCKSDPLVELVNRTWLWPFLSPLTILCVIADAYHLGTLQRTN